MTYDMVGTSVRDLINNKFKDEVYSKLKNSILQLQYT